MTRPLKISSNGLLALIDTFHMFFFFNLNDEQSPRWFSGQTSTPTVITQDVSLDLGRVKSHDPWILDPGKIKSHDLGLFSQQTHSRIYKKNYQVPGARFSAASAAVLSGPTPRTKGET